MDSEKPLTSADNRDNRKEVDKTIVNIKRAQKGLEKLFNKLNKDLRLLLDKRD